MAVVSEPIAELTVPARAEKLKLVRALVGNAAEDAGCRAEVASQIVIAVNEACMNVIQHGYGKSCDEEIVIVVSRLGDMLHVKVSDSAPPIDIATVHSRDLDDIRPGGLGTFFIDEIMDDWSICQLDNKQGNCLQMTRKIE